MRLLWDSNGHPKGILGVSRDMTQRKQTEEALRESDSRFRKLSSHVPGMIYQFMKRPDGTYCVPFTTESIRSIFGCSPLEVREDFSPIARAILVEDLDKVVGSIESSAQRMTVWECEYRVQIPGRPVRWMFGQSTPERLPDGSIIWHGFNTDITERKQMEEALRRSEIHYRSLFDNSLDAFLFTAPDGSVFDANPAACKMFGRTVEEVRSLGRDGIADTTDPRLHKAIEERSRTGKAHAEITMIRADQTKFPADITSTVFSDQNGLERTFMIIRDITERKRAEEALRESEKRYKQLFNHAPAGIYELDFNEQRFIAVNDVMCRYTGYSEEEFLTMSPYDILSEEGKTLYEQRCRKMVAGENISEAVEYKIYKKSGEELWVALNISPVYANGKVKGVTVVVHDITERHGVEQRLRQSEERLRSLSAELMKAQEKERTRISKELHDELGQSLAMVKHRVRSIGKRLVAYQPQMSHDRDAAVDLVDEIIEKVRHISRDLHPSILEDVGLCPALRSLADNFTQEYEIPVSLEFDEIDASFSKETARNLYRIFQEALTNIAKHAEASQVRVHINKGPEYVYFLIEDDGKGFDTGEARARDEKRKGLGLPLMEERADSVGGTLEITRREGNGGTKILLTVPVEKGGIG
jgi:PAS domain S-box-containing protein